MTEENAKDATAAAEEVASHEGEGTPTERAVGAAVANSPDEPDEPKEPEGPKGDEEPREKEPLAHGTKIRIATAAACVLVVAICAIATVVSTNFADYQKAVDSYQRSAAALQERNEALDQAIASLQFLVSSGAQPLEIQLVTRAQELMGEARAAKDDVPPCPLPLTIFAWSPTRYAYPATMRN